MEKIPITFKHEGHTYSGYLNPVRGTGQPNVWQLIADSYFLGNLRLTPNGWVFDAGKVKTMAELADFFGDVVVAWYQ